MKYIFNLLFIFTLYVLVQQTNAQSYSFIGSFDVFHPSFLNLEYFTPENEQENKNSLVITTFSGVPFSKDGVYIVEDIGKYINSISQIEPALVTKQLQWPNEATSVPFKIFNETAIGLGNGFLVPSKSTGYVSVIPSNTSIPHHLSEKKPDWFYHVAEWWDMNGDGLEDCVTARATVPTNGPSQGELVWFENPGSNQLSQTWQEHVVSSGPDIMIHLLWLDGLSSNEQPQIIAAEFFSTEIRLFWTENNSLWSNSENIQSVVIDNDMGSPFDIQYVDLNNDGKKDLLVTNHQGEADQSAVFAYTVPENWKTDPWPRYVLATNITTLKRGENQASPGRATAFHPNTNATNSKPYIIVGGDGAEVAFMLYPNSEDINNWSYTREDIINTGCTVGQVEVGDINGDSYVEFFVPAFEDNTVYVYTFAPNIIYKE